MMHYPAYTALRALLAAFFLTITALPAGAADVPFTVTDGDTIKLDGQRMRFLEIDTPETYKPKCDNELRQGKAATARLKAMIAQADDVEIQRSGKIDKYERPLIHLSIDGHDAGQLLVDEGLALPWRPGRQAWLERRQHWCGF